MPQPEGEKVEIILVKGICDWADGHKNKLAQPFAAHAAVSLAQFVLDQPNILDFLEAVDLDNPGYLKPKLEIGKTILKPPTKQLSDISKLPGESWPQDLQQKLIFSKGCIQQLESLLKKYQEAFVTCKQTIYLNTANKQLLFSWDRLVDSSDSERHGYLTNFKSERANVMEKFNAIDIDKRSLRDWLGNFRKEITSLKESELDNYLTACQEFVNLGETERKKLHPEKDIDSTTSNINTMMSYTERIEGCWYMVCLDFHFSISNLCRDVASVLGTVSSEALSGLPDVVN